MANLSNINNKFLVTTGGDVGIGSTSPTAKLEVVCANGENALRANFGSSADIFMGFDNANPYLILQDNGNTTTHNFKSNDTHNYIVGSNLGIGTASPARPLSVNSSQISARFTSSSADSQIEIIDSSGTVVFGSSSGNAIVQAGGAERVRIDSSGDLTIQGGRIYVKESDLGNNAVAITRDADEGYVQLFSSGSQTIEIRGNGNSYFNGGNVGIGTTTPNEKLVVGTTGGTQNIEISNNFIQSFNRSGSAGYQNLNFYASSYAFNVGNVGIGTTSPGNLLDVAGDTDINGQLFVTHDANYVAKIKQTATSMSNGAYTFEIDSTSHTSNMSTAGAMSVDVNSGRAFTINGQGKVGIGTTAPQTPLHVNGGLGETIRVQGSSATGKNYIQFADSAGNIDAYIGLGSSTTDKFLIVNFTDEPTQFYQKNGIKMTITNVGDVGIGKTNPSTHLDVQGVITAGDSTTDGAIRRQHQTFATMKPGPSSGGNVDMMFVDHTHSLDITVVAYINTSNVATGRGYSVAAYGSASAGLTQTSFAGNVSALSISYVNTGGSENYILRVTCTYSGVDAPSISVTANGQSTSELRAAT